MAMSWGSNLSIGYARALVLRELGFRNSLVTMNLWFKAQAILRFCYFASFFLLKVVVLSWGSDCATDVLYRYFDSLLKVMSMLWGSNLCIRYIHAFVLLELGFLNSPVTMRILFFKVCAILRLLVKVRFVKDMAVLWWLTCIMIFTYIFRF